MNNAIGEFSLYITRSSFSNGIMRWSAINSDTESDLYGERMSLELYHKMLSYIKNNVPPPADFKKYICSDYWCGGMPYVSLAHYPDLNGKAVLGQPTELFIDGKQLKAKGVFFDNPLGRATWKSLKDDESLPPDEDKIRISIAFLDLAHKHGEGGNIFKRQSTTSVCPECSQGRGNKIYLDGYLVHLATTRKPVNPRTIMEVEDNIMARKSEIKTRKEDAVSIVKDADLVEAIEQEALSTKSDVLVEMSDAEETPVVEESKGKKEMPMDKEDMEDDMDKEEADEKKEKKPEYKALTAEDVVEIVKSLLPKPVEVKLDVAEAIQEIKSEAVAEKSALDISVDNLYTSINSALQSDASYEQRLESLNPVLAELGESIKSVVREKSGYTTPAPVANDNGQILEAIAELSTVVKGLGQEVATMKAEQTKPQAAVNRVPVPRSINPVTQLSSTEPVKEVNPNSVANIVRRSVSRDLPLK